MDRLLDLSTAHQAPYPSGVCFLRGGIFHDFFLRKEQLILLHLDDLVDTSQSSIMRILLFPVLQSRLPDGVPQSTLLALGLEIKLQQIFVRGHRVDVLGLESARLDDILIVAHALLFPLLLILLRLTFLDYFSILENFSVSHLAEAQRLHQDHFLFFGTQRRQLCLDVYIDV